MIKYDIQPHVSTPVRIQTCLQKPENPGRCPFFMDFREGRASVNGERKTDYPALNINTDFANTSSPTNKDL